MGIEHLIKIAPPVWPGGPLSGQPGDLGLFAPMGMGLSGPFPIRPWDDPFSGSPAGFYQYQAPGAHPFLNAPATEPAGGTVYLDDGPSEDDLRVLLRLLGVRSAETHYAAFLGQADDPPEERYLIQLRIVERPALQHMFGVPAGEDFEALTDQPLSVGALAWAFIQDQQATWGSGMSSALRGTMGGDDDWAKESLAFGLLVENAFHGVYRIWSRAWLVTK
jgi:hypothetical protein